MNFTIFENVNNKKGPGFTAVWRFKQEPEWTERRYGKKYNELAVSSTGKYAPIRHCEQRYEVRECYGKPKHEYQNFDLGLFI